MRFRLQTASSFSSVVDFARDLFNRCDDLTVRPTELYSDPMFPDLNRTTALASTG